jgi:hypothetical protein
MKNIAALIEAFGGVNAFGKEIWPDSPYPSQRAALARQRGCIPVHRWPATIRRARARGITITTDQLAAWWHKAGRQYR